MSEAWRVCVAAEYATWYRRWLPDARKLWDWLR